MKMVVAMEGGMRSRRITLLGLCRYLVIFVISRSYHVLDWFSSIEIEPYHARLKYWTLLEISIVYYRF